MPKTQLAKAERLEQFDTYKPLKEMVIIPYDAFKGLSRDRNIDKFYEFRALYMARLALTLQLKGNRNSLETQFKVFLNAILESRNESEFEKNFFARAINLGTSIDKTKEWFIRFNTVMRTEFVYFMTYGKLKPEPLDEYEEKKDRLRIE